MVVDVVGPDNVLAGGCSTTSQRSNPGSSAVSTNSPSAGKRGGGGLSVVACTRATFTP